MVQRSPGRGLQSPSAVAGAFSVQLSHILRQIYLWVLLSTLGAITNATVFYISLSSCSLVVYRNIIGFSIPTTIKFTYFRSFSVRILQMCVVTLFLNNKVLFPINFYIFSYFVVLTSFSISVYSFLYFCLISDLWVKASHLSPLSVMLVVNFS